MRALRPGRHGAKQDRSISALGVRNRDQRAVAADRLQCRIVFQRRPRPTAVGAEGAGAKALLRPVGDEGSAIEYERAVGQLGDLRFTGPGHFSFVGHDVAPLPGSAVVVTVVAEHLLAAIEVAAGNDQSALVRSVLELDAFAGADDHDRTMRLDHLTDFTRLGPGETLVATGNHVLPAVQIAHFTADVLRNSCVVPREQIIKDVNPIRVAVVHGGVGADRLQPMGRDQSALAPSLAAVAACFHDQVLPGTVGPTARVSALADDHDGAAVGDDHVLLSVLRIFLGRVLDALDILGPGKEDLDGLGEFVGPCRRRFRNRRQQARHDAYQEPSHR